MAPISNNDPSSLCQMDSSEFAALQELPGNTQCVDCSVPNPDWGSPNLGILMCFQCSGRHRCVKREDEKAFVVCGLFWLVSPLSTLHSSRRNKHQHARPAERPATHTHTSRSLSPLVFAFFVFGFALARSYLQGLGHTHFFCPVGYHGQVDRSSIATHESGWQRSMQRFPPSSWSVDSQHHDHQSRW